MAFSLGEWVKNHIAPFMVGVQNPNQEAPNIGWMFAMADEFQTTSPVMQTPAGITWARVVGRQKGWGSGTGTVGPTYQLEVAFDSGFTSQVRVLATYIATRDGLGQIWVWETLNPVEQTATFARILVTKSGTDAITFDALAFFGP